MQTTAAPTRERPPPDAPRDAGRFGPRAWLETMRTNNPEQYAEVVKRREEIRERVQAAYTNKYDYMVRWSEAASSDEVDPPVLTVNGQPMTLVGGTGPLQTGLPGLPGGFPVAPGEVVLLDGGVATELEARGHDLSDDLWSARVLQTDPAEIEAVHAAFFAAGARVAITASYQASLEGFERVGIVEQAAHGSTSCQRQAGHAQVGAAHRH